MRSAKLLTTGLATVSAVFVTASASAQILLGDTFAINFTESENTVGGNWNELVTTLNAFIDERLLLSDLRTFADGLSTGVSLSITAPVDTFGLGGREEPPSATRAFPVSGTIPDAAQRRLTFHTSAGQQFVFAGLDDSLTYNLSILSANTGGDRNAHDWIANPGPDQVTISVDPNDTLVHTFSGLTTDGFGNLVLQSTTTDSGGDAQHLNAMELTAIPEPATYAALAGLLALGLVVLRRRRC